MIKQDTSKQHLIFINGLDAVIVPAEKDPLIVGDTRVYPEYILHKNKKINLSEIRNIHYGKYEQEATYSYFAKGVKTNESVSVKFVTKNNDEIVINKTAFLGIGSKQVKQILCIYEYVQYITFKSRFLQYIEQFENRGLINYDGVKIYPEGKILSRKGAIFLPCDYKIVHCGLFIELKDKNNQSTLSKIFDRHPNSNAMKYLAPGDKKISITVDSDVIMAILGKIWKDVA